MTLLELLLAAGVRDWSLRPDLNSGRVELEVKIGRRLYVGVGDSIEEANEQMMRVRLDEVKVGQEHS